MQKDVADQLAAASPNFGFLKGLSPSLVEAAVAAEQHVFRDPVSALMRLRQFGEMLAQEAAATVGLFTGAGDTQLDLLLRLADRHALPRDVADLFHDLRRTGNAATHQGIGNRSDALNQLRTARTLAIWFVRSFGKTPSLTVGRFIPPPDPADQDEALHAELERLRQQLAEANSIQFETAQVEAKMRAVAEQAAKQAYAELEATIVAAQQPEELAIAAQDAADAQWAAHLDSLQQEATTASRTELDAVAQQANSAGEPEQLDLDEADNLTAEQRAAVEASPGYLRIVAGPGSGKTRVITERIRHFVNAGWFEPRQILAVTFTVKAAHEMRVRLRKRLLNRSHGITIKTLHGLALSIVRRDPNAAGLPETFDLGLPETRRDSLLDRVLDRLRMDATIPASLRAPEAALAAIADLKHSAPYRLIRGDNSPEVSLCRAFDDQVFSEHAVSFDDLGIAALRLFDSKPELLQTLQRRYRAVFVDECQDLDATQFHILKQLTEAHGVLTVVGDDDQCIYGWRGANPGYLRDFAEHFGKVNTLLLQQNHRSTRLLVAAAKATIDLNAIRIPKHLVSATGEQGKRIRVLRLEEQKQEVSRVVDEVALLLQNGERPSDIAILARNNGLIQSVIMEARTQGVPVHAANALRSSDGVNIINLMRTVRDGPGDRFFQSTVNLGQRRVRKSAFRDFAESQGEAVQPDGIESLLRKWADCTTGDTSATESTRTFLAAIDDARERVETHKPLDVLQRLVNELDFPTVTSGSSQRDELSAATALALEVARRHGSAIGREAWGEIIAELDEVRLGDDSLDDAVSVLTIHKSKGLEFDHVFIMGVQGDVFPNLHFAESDPSQMEEERRLFYVGITRAKRALVLSNHARLRAGTRTGDDKDGFIREIPREFLVEDD